jgi:predicted amidophosphoribosyltransferase
MLVDDVFTTGATADECARVLKSSGAEAVIVYTLAKTILN